MAAGLGFKTFTTGEVLTSADVNGYLMQGVLVFASAAARNAAITSPQEGQFAFTKDTNGLWYYDGAAWVASGATGDIEGVTAGVGISGGGTSGTVTITNSMATEITAKGDLIAGTGSATFDNLPVGTNGESLVADSSTSTGLRYNANYSAGKNAIINGAFDNWQRGTSFSNPTALAYNADRFAFYFDGTGATRTISRQTFTPGTAPVAGYEGQYFLRYAQTVAGTGNTINLLYQKIENVQSFAGQSIVLSFWAKADAARSITCTANQNFGSGGSADVDTNFTGTASVTTSYQRFSFTVTVPSISGKTIGTSSFLGIRLFLPAGTTPTIDIWGVQVEAGSVATAFQTATGTLQGELAACQRYYYRITPSVTNGAFSVGNNYSTTINTSVIYPKVTLRTTPTLETSGTASNYKINTAGTAVTCSSVPVIDQTSTDIIALNSTVASGLTAGNAGILAANSGTTSILAFSAEL